MSGGALLRPAGLLLALAVVAAACSGPDVRVTAPDDPPPSGSPSAEPDAGEPPAPPDPTPAPLPTPTAEPEGRAQLPDDQVFEPGPRIAVQTSEGQIFTILGDGSGRVPLTAAEEGHTNTNPVWSDDANRLAWVSTDQATGEAEVRGARFDGSLWSAVPVPHRPRAVDWDPISRSVATLSPTDSGLLELGVADLTSGTGYQRVDDGTPFWFSWNPDADGFLVHASGVRLDLVPLDGLPQVFQQMPGDFQTPVWLPGAVEFVYADEIDDQQFLVVAGTEGSGRRALITYDGYLQFTASDQSGLIALQVIDPSRAPVADVITASLSRQGEFADIIDPIPRNELTIMATFGGEPFVVYPGPENFQPHPVLAFYWSPDGESLAWLLEVEPGDGDCGSETALYQWEFWTQNSFVDGPRFHPTPTFACDYVPVFDQLDQAVSFWSPDNTELVYAGTEPVTGERGVWTLVVGGLGLPRLVADGEIGVWSPNEAGSAASSSL